MDKNTVFRPAKRGLLSHIRRLLNGFKGLGILLLVILWSASLGSAQAGKGGEGKGKNELGGGCGNSNRGHTQTSGQK